MLNIIISELLELYDTMSPNEVTVEKNEVAIKYVDDGFVAIDPIQTLNEKKLQNGLLLKVDIILVGMISLIMLVNQWVGNIQSYHPQKCLSNNLTA